MNVCFGMLAAPCTFCGFLTFSRYSGRTPTSSPYRAPFATYSFGGPATSLKRSVGFASPPHGGFALLVVETTLLILSTIDTGTNTAHRPSGIFSRTYIASAKQISVRTPLPLCVLFRHTSWMTPRGSRRWLRNTAPLKKMAVEESPLGPLYGRDRVVPGRRGRTLHFEKESRPARRLR